MANTEINSPLNTCLRSNMKVVEAKCDIDVFNDPCFKDACLNSPITIIQGLMKHPLVDMSKECSFDIKDIAKQYGNQSITLLNQKIDSSGWNLSHESTSYFEASTVKEYCDYHQSLETLLNSGVMSYLTHLPESQQDYALYLLQKNSFDALKSKNESISSSSEGMNSLRTNSSDCHETELEPILSQREYLKIKLREVKDGSYRTRTLPENMNTCINSPSSQVTYEYQPENMGDVEESILLRKVLSLSKTRKQKKSKESFCCREILQPSRMEFDCSIDSSVEHAVFMSTFQWNTMSKVEYLRENKNVLFQLSNSYSQVNDISKSEQKLISHQNTTNEYCLYPNILPVSVNKELLSLVGGNDIGKAIKSIHDTFKLSAKREIKATSEIPDRFSGDTLFLSNKRIMSAISQYRSSIRHNDTKIESKLRSFVNIGKMCSVCRIKTISSFKAMILPASKISIEGIHYIDFPMSHSLPSNCCINHDYCHLCADKFETRANLTIILCKEVAECNNAMYFIELHLLGATAIISPVELPIGISSSNLRINDFLCKFADSYVSSGRLQEELIYGLQHHHVLAETSKVRCCDDIKSPSSVIDIEKSSPDIECVKMATISDAYRGWIKFCCNLDIRSWSTHMNSIKLHIPEWMMYQSGEDMLGRLRQSVEGMNTPQVYIKVPGVWTGGHEENLRFRSINSNIGPGSSEWYGVECKYLNRLRAIVLKEFKVDILRDEGLWYPNAQWLHSMNIPYIHGIQRAGDVVVLRGDTLHWVRSLGFAVHFSWNFGTFDRDQFETSMERYKINEVLTMTGKPYQSLVPMKTLNLDLTKEVMAYLACTRPTVEWNANFKPSYYHLKNFQKACRFSDLTMKKVVTDKSLLIHMFVELVDSIEEIKKLTSRSVILSGLTPSAMVPGSAVIHCDSKSCRREIFEAYIHCPSCGYICLHCATCGPCIERPSKQNKQLLKDNATVPSHSCASYIHTKDAAFKYKSSLQNLTDHMHSFAKAIMWTYPDLKSHVIEILTSLRMHHASFKSPVIDVHSDLVNDESIVRKDVEVALGCNNFFILSTGRVMISKKINSSSNNISDDTSLIQDHPENNINDKRLLKRQNIAIADEDFNGINGNDVGLTSPITPKQSELLESTNSAMSLTSQHNAIIENPEMKCLENFQSFQSLQKFTNQIGRLKIKLPAGLKCNLKPVSKKHKTTKTLINPTESSSVTESLMPKSQLPSPKSLKLELSEQELFDFDCLGLNWESHNTQSDTLPSTIPQNLVPKKKEESIIDSHEALGDYVDEFDSFCNEIALNYNIIKTPKIREKRNKSVQCYDVTQAAINPIQITPAPLVSNKYPTPTTNYQNPFIPIGINPTYVSVQHQQINCQIPFNFPQIGVPVQLVIAPVMFTPEHFQLFQHKFDNKVESVPVRKFQILQQNNNHL